MLLGCADCAMKPSSAQMANANVAAEREWTGIQDICITSYRGRVADRTNWRIYFS
jgi:hypothetical protein